MAGSATEAARESRGPARLARRRHPSLLAGAVAIRAGSAAKIPRVQVLELVSAVAVCSLALGISVAMTGAGPPNSTRRQLSRFL